jgi:hypothetical protein
MPTVSKKKQVINAATAVMNDLPCLKLSLVIPFSEMGKEREGASYFIPVKLRDAEGNLLKGDGVTPVPSENGKQQLYVLKNGDYTYEPYQQDGRTLRPEVRTEGKKATPHIDWAKTVIDPQIVWPDGKMRDIDIRIKANNPQSPEDFRETRAAAGAKRAESSVEQMSNESLEAKLLALQAELAKRTAAAPATQ